MALQFCSLLCNILQMCLAVIVFTLLFDAFFVTTFLQSAESAIMLPLELVASEHGDSLNNSHQNDLLLKILIAVAVFLLVLAAGAAYLFNFKKLFKRNCKKKRNYSDREAHEAETQPLEERGRQDYLEHINYQLENNVDRATENVYVTGNRNSEDGRNDQDSEHMYDLVYEASDVPNTDNGINSHNEHSTRNYDVTRNFKNKVKEVKDEKKSSEGPARHFTVIDMENGSNSRNGRLLADKYRNSRTRTDNNFMNVQSQSYNNSIVSDELQFSHTPRNRMAIAYRATMPDDRNLISHRDPKDSGYVEMSPSPKKYINKPYFLRDMDSKDIIEDLYLTNIAQTNLAGSNSRNKTNLLSDRRSRGRPSVLVDEDEILSSVPPPADGRITVDSFPALTNNQPVVCSRPLMTSTLKREVPFRMLKRDAPSRVPVSRKSSTERHKKLGTVLEPNVRLQSEKTYFVDKNSKIALDSYIGGPPSAVSRTVGGHPSAVSSTVGSPSSAVSRSGGYYSPVTDDRFGGSPPPAVSCPITGPPPAVSRPVSGPPPAVSRPVSGPPPAVSRPGGGPPPAVSRPGGGPPPAVSRTGGGPPLAVSRTGGGPPLATGDHSGGDCSPRIGGSSVGDYSRVIGDGYAGSYNPDNYSRILYDYVTENEHNFMEYIPHSERVLSLTEENSKDVDLYDSLEVECPSSSGNEQIYQNYPSTVCSNYLPVDRRQNLFVDSSTDQKFKPSSLSSLDRQRQLLVHSPVDEQKELEIHFHTGQESETFPRCSQYRKSLPAVSSRNQSMTPGISYRKSFSSHNSRQPYENSRSPEVIGNDNGRGGIV